VFSCIYFFKENFLSRNKVFDNNIKKADALKNNECLQKGNNGAAISLMSQLNK